MVEKPTLVTVRHIKDFFQKEKLRFCKVWELRKMHNKSRIEKSSVVFPLTVFLLFPIYELFDLIFDLEENPLNKTVPWELYELQVNYIKNLPWNNDWRKQKISIFVKL